MTSLVQVKGQIREYRETEDEANLSVSGRWIGLKMIVHYALDGTSNVSLYFSSNLQLIQKLHVHHGVTFLFFAVCGDA